MGAAVTKRPAREAPPSRKHLDDIADDYCRVIGTRRVRDVPLKKMGKVKLVKQVVDDEQGRWLAYSMLVPKLPAEEWGLILGDLLHNARSALDTLVCQLAILNGKRPHRRKGFPIYDKAPTGHRERQRFKASLKGLKPKPRERHTRLAALLFGGVKHLHTYV